MTQVRIWSLLLGVLLLAGAAAAQEQGKSASPLIGTPVLLHPAGAPTGVVVVFSSADGWEEDERRLGHALTRKGLVVIGIDLPATAARMAAGTDACVTLVWEVEEASHRAQRDLKLPAYRFPTLAGIGAGASMALAVAGQAQAATFARVVAVDPDGVPPAAKPLCPATAGGAVTLPAVTMPAEPRPFPVSVILTPAAPAGARAAATALAGDHREITLTDSTLAAPQALVEAVHPPAVAPDPLGDLPLVELPVSLPAGIFAVLYSGDGGWRDLDRDLAAILQRDGLPVVGVDALHYYWKHRGPEESAADLVRILHAYRQKWGAERVVLIGFSFGADVLPAVFNRLPAEEQARVVQMSLLAFAADADFEVTVSGWLGGHSPGAQPTLPEVRRIPSRLIQCFYGAEDEEAACGKLEGSGVEIVKTTGGHHFDGDYPALARRIIEGMRQRQAP